MPLLILVLLNAILGGDQNANILTLTQNEIKLIPKNNTFTLEPKEFQINLLCKSEWFLALYKDKEVEELKNVEYLPKLKGTGAAWEPENGNFPINEWNSKEDIYNLKVDNTDLGFSDKDIKEIKDLILKYNAKPDIIFTFGYYPLKYDTDKEGLKIVKSINENKLSNCQGTYFLYLFKSAEENKHISIEKVIKYKIIIK